MKRGLKASQSTDTLYDVSSYNRYPDEKGTERLEGEDDELYCRRSYNRYPDEKGTESPDPLSYPPPLHAVTTVTPMKRGLKEPPTTPTPRPTTCYNRFPDEKGTESQGSYPPRR